MERDARAMGWLMVGQLVSVTICDGREATFLDNYSDTNTETEHLTTTEDEDDFDIDSRLGLSNSRGGSPEPQDVIVGRVYSYDYIVKLLILSKPNICQANLDLETVNNPGTPEESYADSVMISARNIKNVEVLESGNGVAAFTQEQLVQEYAMGDQSRLD